MTTTAQPTRALRGSLFITTHEAVELERDAAFADGVDAGFRLAGQLIEVAVAEALHRPDGHGGPDLDEATRARALDLYARYLGIGATP